MPRITRKRSVSRRQQIALLLGSNHSVIDIARMLDLTPQAVYAFIDRHSIAGFSLAQPD
jgi:DNA-binding CsgD family transcriptional regulator